jgi:hypothetical protein
VAVYRHTRTVLFGDIDGMHSVCLVHGWLSSAAVFVWLWRYLIVYFFHYQSDTDWKISSSGVISVNTGVTLSQATKGGYSLIVKAADGGTPALTGSATVWIAVKTCSSGTATIISSVIILWISVFAACLTIA